METQGSRYMLRSLNIFSLIFIHLNLFGAQSVSAHPMVQSWQNRTGSGPGFSLAPKITYFNTSENYNALSQTAALASALSIQRYYIDANLSYGFDEKFFVFGRISALSSKINTGSSLDQTSFGFSDQLIGAAYRVFQNQSGTSISLQGEVSVPAYSVNTAKVAGKPFLGDGSVDITGGAFAEIPLSTSKNAQFYLDAGAGYTYRSYGFSAAVPWNILLKRYPVESGITLAAGARGNISLSTDTTSLSASSSDQLIGAGGSNLIYAVNPAWVLGQAAIGYQTKDFTQYTLSAAMSFTGTNAPNGIQIALGAQFDFGANERKKTPSIIRPGAFKTYDLAAKITAVNDQLYLVKIDQGSNSGVEKGQVFDIFKEERAIAQAKVTQVRGDEAALRVIEYYQEQSIDTDAIAKRVVP